MIEFDANAVVHINESLTAEQIHDIERELADVRGVVSACAHIKTPHLLIVDYDPRSLQASQLVKHIQRNGLHAALIGGI
ncbi:MAG: heavy-metal-associated domain-containing protein [Candidatus Thiodiazotropha sp.]